MDSLTTQSLWLPEGWQGPARVDLADGHVAAVRALDGAAAGQTRWLLPGVPNLHSHAFQRAMAGFAERRGNPARISHARPATAADPSAVTRRVPSSRLDVVSTTPSPSFSPRAASRQRLDALATDGRGNSGPADSFWTWRETMYAFAGRMTPETLYAVAAQLYVEMLEAGYTWVCEFHYLHHRSDGTPYDDPAAMSQALIAAARDTGIGLTLLPVLYMTGGFDARPLGERQRRFGHDVDGYLRLLSSLRGQQDQRLRVGVALHSLRAVPPEAMRAVLESGLCDDVPIHIHIAEQIAEVEDSLAIRNARPVHWLLDNAPVDQRWSLVHATHMTDGETRAVAASGATVVLCPSTEANLGDGLFPMREYLAADGAWGIGSDSHISVSPVEELRWLEYGQRLVSHHRNIVASDDHPSVGDTLFAGALHGGRATGAAIGVIEPAQPGGAVTGGFAGSPADFLVLDEQAPVLVGHDDATVLDAWLFSGNRPALREVWAGGQARVLDGRHRDHDAVLRRYRQAMAALLAD